MQLESLFWGELDSLCQRAKKLSGFTEDAGNPENERWFRQVETGRFDLGVGHGHFGLVPATLVVGRGELVSESEQYLNQQYGRVAGLNELRQSVHIPRYLLVAKIVGANPYNFAIQEKCPKGWKFLPKFTASNSHQKRAIAELYWNTFDNFADIEAQNSKMTMLMSRNSEALPEFYLGRLSHWLNVAEQTQVRGETKGEERRLRASYLQDQKRIRGIIVEIKRTGLLNKLVFPMGLFFKHFGYTDLVYDSLGRFHLPLCAINVFPQFYGAAYWVWNVLMHSSSQSPLWAVRETEKWRSAFETRAPQSLKEVFKLGFHLNLLERVAATLLVDLPLRRSPFDRLKNPRFHGARRIFTVVLDRTLNKLKEDWGSGEAFRVLTEVYSKI